MVADFAENYSVGALLYAPALHNGVARLICDERIKPPFSLALCLEDAISDDAVETAEARLIETFSEVWQAAQNGQHFCVTDNAQDHRDAMRAGKSVGSDRMNEVKCHGNWAEKVRILGSVYGIKPEEVRREAN